MKYLITILLSFNLFCQEAPELQVSEIAVAEPISYEPPPIDLSVSMSSKPNSFTYLGLGATGLGIPFVPDVSVGNRGLNRHHTWDVNAGVFALPTKNLSVAMGYAQISYLYFFNPSAGFYLGTGLTIGSGEIKMKETRDFFSKVTLLPYLNLPFTLGYQFESSTRHRFFQFQVTPRLTTTLSYGMGF